MDSEIEGMKIGIKTDKYAFYMSHLFNENPFCYYEVIDGEYTGRILTTSSGLKLARVDYKNSYIHGSVTVHNNWKLYAKGLACLDKHYYGFRFNNKIYSLNRPIETENNNGLDVKHIYNDLVNSKNKSYLAIENKDKFKRDFFNYFKELEINEEFDVDFEVNFVIECFIQFENDKKDFNNIFTYEYFINKYPQLLSKYRKISDLQTSIVNIVKKEFIKIETETAAFYSRDILEEYVLADIDKMSAVELPYSDEYLNSKIQNFDNLDIIKIELRNFIVENDYIISQSNLDNYLDSIIKKDKRIKDIAHDREEMLMPIFDKYNNNAIIYLKEDVLNKFINNDIENLSGIEKEQYDLIFTFIKPYFKKAVLDHRNKPRRVVKMLPDFINFAKKIYSTLFNIGFLYLDKEEVVFNEKLDLNKYKNIILELK